MTKRFIPYGHQDIAKEDIQAVVKVLESDWLTQGPSIEEFERAVATYCGATYAVAVSNATAALHIACLAAGLQEGNQLWTSPNTFVASANCGRYCGASVDFVDIDGTTYNLSVRELEEKLKQGTIPECIIPVHFSGQSCDMEPIYKLCRQYGVKTIIEDASHAIGGEYQGEKIGNCRYSDMTVFSFHPVKIVTTGEGGMILTNREDLYQNLIRLRSHGITRDAGKMTEAAHGPWYYQQIELGYNYRMTDLQAALGASQMQRIDQFIEKRRVVAARYNQAFSKIDEIVIPQQESYGDSAWHLYVIQVPTSKRAAVFQRLRESGIGVNVHYIPVHTQPYYRQLDHNAGDFPQAEAYYARAISLPMYYGLTTEEQDFVIAAVKEALQE